MEQLEAKNLQKKLMMACILMVLLGFGYLAFGIFEMVRIIFSLGMI